MELALPPEVQRQIRIEMRQQDVRQELCRLSGERKRELLRADLLVPRAADVTMRADPRLHRCFGSVRVRTNNNRAAGVVLCDFGD